MRSRTVGLSFCLKFVLYNMLILYFHLFQRGFEVLNATFQAFVYVTIVLRYGPLLQKYLIFH